MPTTVEKRILTATTMTAEMLDHRWLFIDLKGRREMPAAVFCPLYFQPTLTVNIEIEPPSKPSTGNVTTSPSRCVART